MKSLSIAAAAVAIAAAAPAQAHMPYLLPNLFDVTKRDHVTVQAAFTETPFIADVAMRSADFRAEGPGGAQPAVQVVYLKDVAMFEAALPSDGTYRVSSGERLGRKGKMHRGADGAWRMVGEGDDPPTGAQLVEVQSVTVAEAYVTRGAPSREVLKPREEGLELRPITHPSEVFAAAPARFQLLFGGRPLADCEVKLYRAAGFFDGRSIAAETRSAADGAVTLTPPDAGTYLVLIRHRTEAPAGSETPYRSYTYTLTFLAT
jgi:uncharacterized GH25 family protein